MTFKIFPQDYELWADTGLVNPEKVKDELRFYRLDRNRKFYTLKAPGYAPYRFSINPGSSAFVEAKLEPRPDSLELLAEVPSGRQPKSVVFTPDGTWALVTQLSGSGVDVYSLDPIKRVKEIDIPPPGNRSTGYVEFAFLPWRDEIWVSQMTTGLIHVIKLSTLETQGSFSSGGIWPKVILADPRCPYVFVSNWVSKDVSLIDPENRTVLRTLKCPGIPRGMALDGDGSHLYVANYDTGNVEKFDLHTFEPMGPLLLGPGAKRHLVADAAHSRLYASDMANGDVSVIDMHTDKLIKKIPMGPKLNTMDISSDGRYVFVSSRGSNNPETYLKKGPDLGTLSVLDTQKLEKVAWVWGRNQPTGLAVHPTRPWIAFTDFLDDNLEFYDYSGLVLSGRN